MESTRGVADLPKGIPKEKKNKIFTLSVLFVRKIVRIFAPTNYKNMTTLREKNDAFIRDMLLNCALIDSGV